MTEVGIRTGSEIGVIFDVHIMTTECWTITGILIDSISTVFINWGLERF